MSSNAGLAQTFAEPGAGCNLKPNEPAPRARPRPDTRRALKLPAAEMAPFDRFVAADVSRRQSFCERRRRGIVVASGRLQGSSSVGATSSSPCRPYGARTSLRIRCYKDAAPDGVEQRRANQSRLTSAPPARGSGRAPLRRRRGERQLRPASAGLTGQGPCCDQSGRLAKAAGALLCQSRRVGNAGDTLPGQSRRVRNAGDDCVYQCRRVGNAAASRPRRSGTAQTGGEAGFYRCGFELTGAVGGPTYWKRDRLGWFTSDHLGPVRANIKSCTVDPSKGLPTYAQH